YIRYTKKSFIRDLFKKVNKIISENNFNGIYFDGKNSWVRVYDNLEYLYVPSKFGGLLGLENKKGFESIEIDFVNKNLKDGQVFIDIGANFGLYSVFVSKKFPNAKIHSFEPLPETFEIFQKNINHNICDNITSNNQGLSFEKGELYFTNDRYAGNHIVMNPTKTLNLTKVEVTILDEYVKEKAITKVDFIKCDVEGAELLVLQGAKEVIEKFHPIILIEIYDEWTNRFGHSANDVIEYLLSFGYKIKMINHKSEKIEEFDKNKMNEAYDFIFYTCENLNFGDK
ncbi:MAG: FkbM family methyltransferase, partial [Flavobacteriales bacterium]|nr:FkbM family methyltransferase [Flavobacteriales bacterium]